MESRRPEYGYTPEPNPAGQAGERDEFVTDPGYPPVSGDGPGSPAEGGLVPSDRSVAGSGAASEPGPARESGPFHATTCPRHPDTAAFARCQRCSRPACGQCQRQAAVGFHCVDCVAAAEDYQRQVAPRNAVGARAGEDRPTVTIALIAICLIVFALQYAGLDATLSRYLMFSPAWVFLEPWTFITSGFLHGSLLHVALNVYALWAVGQYLERVLGWWRFLAVFLVSVIGGHAAVLLLTPGLEDAWFGGTVGASGGVFGLFGALLVVQRKLGGQAAQVIVLIVINFVISFIYPNISWEGHLGGLIAGTVLIASMFAMRPRRTPGADREKLARKSAVWHGGLAVALTVAMLVAAYLKWQIVFSGGGSIPGFV